MRTLQKAGVIKDNKMFQMQRTSMFQRKLFYGISRLSFYAQKCKYCKPLLHQLQSELIMIKLFKLVNFLLICIYRFVIVDFPLHEFFYI